MQISDLIPWGRQKDNPPNSDEERDTHPLAHFQRDINNVFDDFWQRIEKSWNGKKGALGSFGPHTDILEAENSFEIAIELPGLSEEDIDISLSGDAMTIRGEKRNEHNDKRKGVYLSERSYGAFYHTIPLPPGLETDKASAKFSRGVLTVTLPKSTGANAKVKRIPVKSA